MMDDCRSCGRPGKITYRVGSPAQVTMCWDCAPSYADAVAVGLLDEFPTEEATSRGR